MPKSNIVKALNQLKAQDTMSMVMFVLYKLKDNPEYATISELGYLLDGPNLGKLLDYYGGMTITIPTKQEFRLVTGALLLYQYSTIEGVEFTEACKMLDRTEAEIKEIKAVYQQVKETLEKYEFNRQGA